MLKRGGIALASALALSACVGGVVPPSPGSRPVVGPSQPPRTNVPGPVRQPVPSTPIAPRPATPVPAAKNAAAAGLVAGPSVSALPITEDAAARALAAFRISCCQQRQQLTGQGAGCHRAGGSVGRFMDGWSSGDGRDERDG